MSKSLLRSPSPEYPFEDGFRCSLVKRARSVLSDSKCSAISSWEAKDQELQEECSPIRQNRQQISPNNVRWKGQDNLDLHEGLQEIASSLSSISDTLGTAIEAERNLAVTRRELRRSPMKRISALPGPDKLETASVENLGLTKETHLKASQDVAMAIATKAKLLLRDLKYIKADLTFTKERCAQLEEENRRLRDSLDKGLGPEEDDLVRLQLETLLAEKARLAQENATYARENQFLHEVVQYHQLTLRDVVLLDENILEGAEYVMDTAFDSPESMKLSEKEIQALHNGLEIS